MRSIRSRLGVAALALVGWCASPSEAAPLTSAFVDEVYVDLLQRSSDRAGHDFFRSALDIGTLGRANVALAVMGSAEYQGRLVDAYFETLLHRAVDPTGKSGFTAALLAGTRDEAVLAAILGSAEYFAGRGGGTDGGFVDALFQDILHRPVDEAGRAGFLGLLASGGSRDTIASLVLNSVESRQAFVQRCYQSLLHRGADPSGLQSFTGALQAGASNEAVVSAIVGSDEYLARIGADPAGRPASFGACAPIALDVDGALGTQSHTALGSTVDASLLAGDGAAFAAQTVPAPLSLSLLLLGTTGLGLWRWGARRAAHTARAPGARS